MIFGLQVRCGELDILKILGFFREIVWIFLEIFWNCFRIFWNFYLAFWEFFWRIFWEDFWEEFFFTLELVCQDFGLSQEFVSQGRKENCNP